MLPEITAVFGALGVTDIRATSVRGHESEVAAQAIADGRTTIVAVGGDGTSSNVANAILRSKRNTRLAVLPAGTGNDFAKVLGTAKAGIHEVARLALGDSDSAVDVGLAEDDFFLNSCGFGFDVAVLDDISRSTWLPGNAVYVYAALKQLFGYRGTQIGVESDAGRSEPTLHLMLVVANSPWFGGTFLIAPDASVSDGLLDVISIGDVAPHRRLAMLAAAMRGAHLAYSDCRSSRTRRLVATFPVTPTYQVDGELRRARSTSVSIRCVPAALRVVHSGSAPRGARKTADSLVLAV